MKDDFDSQVARAVERVAAMDEADGFRDRELSTIVFALEAGLKFPITGAHFDAYVMLLDYRRESVLTPTPDTNQ